MNKFEHEWERRLVKLQLTRGGFTQELKQSIENTIDHNRSKRQTPLMWGTLTSGILFIVILAVPYYFSERGIGTEHNGDTFSQYHSNSTTESTNSIPANPKNSSTFTDDGNFIIAENTGSAMHAFKRVVEVANFKVFAPTDMTRLDNVKLNLKANDLQLGFKQPNITIMEFPDRPDYDLSHVDPSYNPKIITINGQNWTYMQPLGNNGDEKEFAIYMNGTNVTIYSQMPYDEMVKFVESIRLASLNQ